MQKNTNIYHNLGYWFLSLIVLVFAGFYTTYFSVFFQPRPAVIHIHFTLMALWIAMLITQPFLIKYKKRSLHRLVGKISYVLVPLVLLFSFLMIRVGYYRYVNELQEQVAKGLNHFTDAEILKLAADGPIAIFYFSWFALFYILAIINRRKSSVHARYMVATALTLLGPTVDRIIMIPLQTENIGFIPAYVIAFLIADIVLVILLIKDYKTKKPIKTLATCLAIYITGQVLYFVVPRFDWWPDFMAFIMKPVP
ncbi:MAG: hypothetical protein ACXWV2_13100 [Chitinophagaceae bacterium]